MTVDQTRYRELINVGVSEGAARILADAAANLASPVSSQSGLSFLLSGSGNPPGVIDTGFKGFIECPYAGTITAWRALGDQSGSISVGVWKDTYANYPPLVGDLILTASITAAVKNQATGLSIAVAAGDILGFNVVSVTALTQVTIALAITKLS